MAASSRGFVKLPNALLTDSSLDAHCRLLAACLLMYARDKDVCYPSQQRLADDLGWPVLAVKRHCRHLVQASRICVVRKARRGQKRAGIVNMYDVTRLKNPDLSVDSILRSPPRKYDIATTQVWNRTSTQVSDDEALRRHSNETEEERDALRADRESFSMARDLAPRAETETEPEPDGISDQESRLASADNERVAEIAKWVGLVKAMGGLSGGLYGLRDVPEAIRNDVGRLLGATA